MNSRLRQIFKWIGLSLAGVLGILVLLLCIGVLRLWLGHKAHINDKNNANQPELTQAIIAQDSSAVSASLNERSVNKPSTHGTPPLALAVRKGSAANVSALLKKGANPNAVLKTGGWTVLALAVESGNLAKAQALIQAGASVEKTNAVGETPLAIASQQMDAKMAALLLANGAKVDERGEAEVSPLYIAASDCNAELVKLYLSYGADPMLKSYLNITPLEIAINRASQPIQDKFDQDWHDRALAVVDLMQKALEERKAKSTP